MSYFGYTNYGSQGLILNNLFISGVQSVETNANFNREPINIAGVGTLKTQINRQIVPSISFDQIITNKDVMSSFVTGDSTVNGLFKHQNNILQFTSGCISEYSISCRVGEFVRSNTRINCYGTYEYVANTGQFTPYLSNIAPSGVKIPDYSSIVVGLNDALIDRVVSFDVNVQFNKEAVYGIGSVAPLQLKLKLPVKVSMSFELEVDQAQLKEISTSLCQDYSENVSVFINTKCNSVNLLSLLMDGAQLESQKYNGRIGSNASISFQYAKYYNSLPLFISDSGTLVNPVGRYVLLESEYPNKTIPKYSSIYKVGNYEITGNLNF